MGDKIVRFAGWFSGIFFLLLGIYSESIALWFLSSFPRNWDEWIFYSIYPLVPICYGIHVIRQLRSTRDGTLKPHTSDHGRPLH